MRTEDDIVLIKMNLYATAIIDLERVEQDPVWLAISSKYDFTISSELKQAIQEYVSAYISREFILTECPSTNGPGEPRVITMEVLFNGVNSNENETGN